MTNIASFFTPIRKRRREDEASVDTEEPEKTRSGNETSSPNTIDISQADRGLLKSLHHTSTRTNTSSSRTNTSSSRTNTSSSSTQRRVLDHVDIPVRRQRTITGFVNPTRVFKAQASSTADGTTRRTFHSSHYTKKGVYIPAWKRLGLSLSGGQSDEEESQNNDTVPAETVQMEGVQSIDLTGDTSSESSEPGESNSKNEAIRPARTVDSRHGVERLTIRSRPGVTKRAILARSSLGVRASEDIDSAYDTRASSADSAPKKTENTTGRPAKRPRRSTNRVSYAEKSRQGHYRLDPLSDDSMQESSSESDFAASESAASVAESDDDMDDVVGLTDDDTNSIKSVDEIPSEEEDLTLLEPEKPKRTVVRTNAARPKGEKAIDSSLPPLANVEDIFSDMAASAMKSGLAAALADIKDRPLNVATMCSGTESPLIALQLISQALQDQGHPGIKVNHHFSAEIEPFKQGFIERNFQPKILFRDAREFINHNSDTATTAYGAEVKIPRDLDLFIAGFVCKDLSRLNNRPKNLDDEGETGDTWSAVYNYTKRFRPSVVLIENVKATVTFWNGFQPRWNEIGYESMWHFCDSKHYYLPQTRQRMYMIAVNKELFGKGAASAVQEWKNKMIGLQRPCSSPFEAFLAQDSSSPSNHISRLNESDWVLCKLRYDSIRSDMRLGRRHPVSQWSEDGSVRPPDFADRKWYLSQSSRVYDAIDIKYLIEAAKTGEDSLYKMAIWDVSQNVERFNAPHGIAPCITPNGCDFISNRQTALNGSQLLLLQGMPMSKLLFGKETQKDQQDLAGNAMSTTVIGASILSALIAARKSFRTTPVVFDSNVDNPTLAPKIASDFVVPEAMEQTAIPPPKPSEIDIEELERDARLSSALCNCEGAKHVSTSNIQECGQCGHTACSSCAGNPRHEYIGEIQRNGLVLPTDFERKWRPRLPGRVHLSRFSEAQALASKELGNSLKAFTERLSQIDFESQYFTLSRFKRSDGSWQVVYDSTEATLELSIGKLVQWHLYVTCPPSESGKSPLRAILSQPIARGLVENLLMEPAWEIFTPSSSKLTLSLSASSGRTNSWRNRLGLLDYRTETVPLQIDITVEELPGKSNAGVLAGKYALLPNCGTSFSSLYKKIDSGRNPLYLFHDPDPIGPDKLDSFVFSHTASRLPFGQVRPCLARLLPSWRPWNLSDKQQRSVEVTIPGVWTESKLGLGMDSPPIETKVAPLSEVSKHLEDCSRATMVLEATIPCHSSTYQWALEKVKLLPSTQWHSIQMDHPNPGCSCAPAFPQILWNVSDKGESTAHEDRKASALFERAIKTRPQILDVRFSKGPEQSIVQVGVNVLSLVHRARGRIDELKLDECTTSWRLVVDHVEPAWEPFEKLRLSSNANNDVYAGELGLQQDLAEPQKRSLTWMRNQERGIPLTITEVEEEIHPIGWRAEARADATITVRGGILADLPSFGKTVTTIALVHDELRTQTPESIREDNNNRAPPNLPKLLDTNATLIICPPTLVKQWSDELKSFLGNTCYKDYQVVVVEKFAQLQELTIDKVQRSRVIIVSWKVFMDASYVSQMASFTAMPEPASSKPRAFNAWLDYSTKEIPTRLDELQEEGSQAFKANISNVLAERLDQPEFKAIVPLKIGHGSSYKSYSSLKTSNSASKPAKKPSAPKSFPRRSDGWLTYSAAVLHMFRFNRIVVDEYHYLCDDLKNSMAYAAIRTLSSHKRWLLSGTPALANFSDVNQIAGLFGISLGRDDYSGNAMTARLRKKLLAEQTDVERFLSQMETRSYYWHQSRHERAQKFLDDFARQNEPSLTHISCSELIRPVELGLAHHIVYLELSQHLISQRMQMKKLKGSSSDRIDRLNSSLNNSATPEEALLKSALIFQASEDQDGIRGLIEKRQVQIRKTKKELSKFMEEAEGLQRQVKQSDGGHYTTFKRDMQSDYALGDIEVAKKLRALARAAATSYSKTKVAKPLEKLKTVTSNIRASAQELLLRARSLRFIENIEKLVPSLSKDNDQTLHKCSSPNCPETADISRIFIVFQCGHVVCETCLANRVDNEACVDEHCDAPVLATSLLKVSDLGISGNKNEGEQIRLGAKIHAVVSLIEGMPEDEQGVVFVPNDESMTIVEHALESYDITFHSVGNSGPSTSEIVEDFKNNKNPATRRKILILNLNDESASGLNLVNANHVFFIAPILAESQYQYDSAMAQAIARCRRYRQERKVHVYHFGALNTIDVDIMEHRHKRADAIGDVEMAALSVRAGAVDPKKKEKTRLVKNDEGRFVLLPVSWLADQDTVDELRIRGDGGCFTSLINFSESFVEEVEE